MSLSQKITIKSTPKEVFNALLSSDVFGEITGAPAEIDASEGGRFSCFSGQISGRQLEHVTDARIVQAWRASPWPEGLYSVVRFDIEGLDGNTEITLTHTGFPDEMTEHLDGGWHKMYWNPMKAFLED